MRGIRLSWSGAIQVVDGDGELLGQIVLSEGRLAWATHIRQSETLGVLLWRLGRITRKQLATVSATYRTHNGKKKLGAILEEAGMVSRPVLRRCLLLHLRNALHGLLDERDAMAHMAQGPQMEGERFLFSPAEVINPLQQEPELEALLEELEVDLGWQESWFTLNRNNLILRGLTGIPGYMASVVFAHDGDVVVAHNSGVNMDLTSFGVMAAAVLEGAARAASGAPLGALSTVALSCNHGRFTALWLDDERYYFACVLTRSGTDQQAVDAGIEQNLPALREHLLPGDIVDEPGYPRPARSRASGSAALSVPSQAAESVR